MHHAPSRCAHGFLIRAVSSLALVLGATLAAIPARAQIDAGINQNVWKILYGVTDVQLSSPAWLAADDDGDGLSNGAELAAGTNPFSIGFAFGVSSAVMNADGSVALTFATVAGKSYLVQSTTGLGSSAAWTTLSPVVQIMGDGTPQTLTAPAPGTTTTFYRVLVQDVDTDGDGVSDWAEKVTGFDPTTAHTHGSTTDDHTALSNDLLQENVVTITATKATATEPADAVTPATDSATITITRGGTLHFSAITVPLSWSGTGISGVDYAAMPATVTFPVKVGSVTLTVTPLYNANLKTGATVTASALPGGGYVVGGAKSASAVITPAGNTSGTGLTGMYYNGTKTTVTPYQPSLFTGAPALTRLDPVMNLTWNSGSPGTGVNATYFGVRWQGQVQPQYSETYYFDIVADDGVKLWVNGKLIIDTWSYISGDRLGGIALQAGVLYDIQIDYYQYTGADTMALNWYSNSQTKQIVPTNRLYPLTTTAVPPAIVSAPTAIGFVGQAFNFNVLASASGGLTTTYGLGAGSGPLPPGLTLNATTGLISGTPTTPGDYQVSLTATTTLGTGGSVLDIQILSAGSGVTRELWTGLAGSGVSDIPLTTAPGSSDNTLTSLEDTTVYGNNTGERLRGYFTAPATGNYYFWLAGSNNAELWISDDSQTVNLIRRALVIPPGTGLENWNASGQTHQRSPWLALTAGQTYYYEVLHNTGSAGATSNVSVGFVQDSLGTATAPTGPVPGYVLTQYNYPTAIAAQGALYITNLSPQGTSVSTATGSANLRLLPGNTQAILHFNYGGLSSPRTAYHIHISPDTSGSGPIVFDLDDVDKFHPEDKTADGGYIWNIAPSGIYSTAQIVAAIQNGTTYFNVHTVNFPNGEIRGFLTLVDGSQTPPTLAPDPGFTDDSSTDAGAARFLGQAAFGAAAADMTAVQFNGYAAWITSQMALPVTHLLPDVQAQMAASPNTNLSGAMLDNAWWRAAVTQPDQLRQRVAFALSEILVVSDTNSTLGNLPYSLASYDDTLADRAFGNFRDIMEATTLHPAMGYWLNMQGNTKGNLATGYHPNENYAREIMQLFSIGLNRLWPDGSVVLDSTGSLVPTYNQGTITNGFARVFTGWTWHQALQASGQLPTNFYPAADWINPMTMVKNYHELGNKTLLNNVVLPPALGYSLTAAATSGSQADTTTVAYDNFCLQDLENGLDNIFNHPNLGPYVCRQLIQRLVESNPTPAYLYRVVAKFNDDGSASHVRGNMTAVINAILLDSEARNFNAASASTSAGKQREPLMRIAGPARTFLTTANSGTYSQSGTAVTTITTSSPHRFSGGDVVGLDFTVNDTGNPPVAPANNPTTASYTILTSPAPTSTTFAVNAASLASVTCSQAANTNTLTVNTSGPAIGEQVYLKFLTGGFTDGAYTVVSVPTTSSFTVTVGGSAPAAVVAGTVIVPKGTGYDNIAKAVGTAPNVITIATNSNLNLVSGQPIWIVAGSAAQLKDAAWTVGTVIDERHFTINNSATYTTETNQSITIYPLAAPVLTRSGNVALPASKFDMGNTNAQIVQSPLDSPTVFNFFYPDYQYPGTLSANNITTPEFQLTTDTNIVTVANTINSTILTSANTNGLSNFKSGSINLDLSPYMNTDYFTFSAGAPVTTGTTVKITVTTTPKTALLVAKLGNLLTGGMFNLNTQAVKAVSDFVNNTTYFPVTQVYTGNTTVPPVVTYPTTCARDVARAVVQQILVSPDYAIQR